MRARLARAFSSQQRIKTGKPITVADEMMHASPAGAARCAACRFGRDRRVRPRRESEQKSFVVAIVRSLVYQKGEPIMAVVVDVRAPGNTMAEYEALMKEVGQWGVGIDSVPGARSHYAWEEDRGVHALDVWESAEAFNAFSQQRSGRRLSAPVSSSARK
jgi:hypothetical protein